MFCWWPRSIQCFIKYWALKTFFFQFESFCNLKTFYCELDSDAAFIVKFPGFVFSQNRIKTSPRLLLLSSQWLLFVFLFSFMCLWNLSYYIVGLCVFLSLLIAFNNITPCQRLVMCALFKQKPILGHSIYFQIFSARVWKLFCFQLLLWQHDFDG